MNFLIMVLIKDYSNADILTERSSDLPYQNFQFTYYNFHIKFLPALFILVRLFYLSICLLDFASNLSDRSSIYDSIPGEEIQQKFPSISVPCYICDMSFYVNSFIQICASY